MGIPTAVQYETLLSRCKTIGECLVWTGPVNDNGYGTFCYQGKRGYVHRLAYCYIKQNDLSEFAGTPKYQVRHTCRNKRCVAIEHLSQPK